MAFARARHRERKARLSAYRQNLAALGVSRSISKPHEVVIFHGEDVFFVKGPTKGSFCFEVTENLLELMGTQQVRIFQVEPGTSSHKCHMPLINPLNDGRSAHLITQITFVVHLDLFKRGRLRQLSPSC